MNNKIVNITIIVLLVLFIIFRVNTALNQMSKTQDEESHPQLDELPATFTGMLPCADCPGIQYILQLDEEDYTELRWYVDRDSSPFKKTGSWEKRSDSLFIFDEDDKIYQAFITDGSQLSLLDKELQRITGELENHYRLERVQEETSIRKHHSRLKKEGVTFVASGNEPFWNVRVSNNEELSFRTPGSQITFSDFDSEQSDGKIELRAQDEKSTLSLTAEKEYCIDTMSGFLFTHQVTLYQNDDELSGCGLLLE